MNLNVNDWKEFYLNKIYNIQMGNKLDKNKMTLENPKYNFVTRIESNNGVDEKVDEVEGVMPFDAGDITVALGGSIGSTFVQEEPFYTAQNVAVLKANFESSNLKLVNIFISRLIKKESEIKYYAFGRELNKHINKDFTIYLPICRDENNNPIIDERKKYSDEGYIPNFKFMENYIKSLHHKPLTTRNNTPEALTDTTKWEWFKIDDLFDVEGTQTTPLEDLEDKGKGLYPYVTTQANNNGISGFYNYSTEEGNCLTIDSAVLGYCSYQEEKFSASDHVEKLTLKNYTLNKHIALFIVTLINKEQYRYCYGRKCNQNNIKKTVIKLPIQTDESGNPILDENKTYSEKGYIPDWDYMENYIKSLPYGDRI